MPEIRVEDLTMAYGDFVLARHVSFAVQHGDIFAIMGGSGSGKSTLLKHLIGLKRPAAGHVYYGDTDFWSIDDEERAALMRGFGVLYQAGALWSSLTLAENVALPLREYTQLRPREIRELAELKLAMVGLRGFEDHYPEEISGGMRKRAGLARALALDPRILFLDEPSAGLDPVNARHLDNLIVSLRDGLEVTVVMVSHELASIFAIANNSIFLDAASRSIRAVGNPHMLLAESRDPAVHAFLTRGEMQQEGLRA